VKEVVNEFRRGSNPGVRPAAAQRRRGTPERSDGGPER